MSEPCAWCSEPAFGPIALSLAGLPVQSAQACLRCATNVAEGFKSLLPGVVSERSKAASAAGKASAAARAAKKAARNEAATEVNGGQRPLDSVDQNSNGGQRALESVAGGGVGGAASTAFEKLNTFNNLNTKEEVEVDPSRANALPTTLSGVECPLSDVDRRQGDRRQGDRRKPPSDFERIGARLNEIRREEGYIAMALHPSSLNAFVSVAFLETGDEERVFDAYRLWLREDWVRKTGGRWQTWLTQWREKVSAVKPKPPPPPRPPPCAKCGGDSEIAPINNVPLCYPCYGDWADAAPAEWNPQAFAAWVTKAAMELQ